MTKKELIIKGLTRREFLGLSGAAALLAGCKLWAA